MRFSRKDVSIRRATPSPEAKALAFSLSFMLHLSPPSLCVLRSDWNFTACFPLLRLFHCSSASVVNTSVRSTQHGKQSIGLITIPLHPSCLNFVHRQYRCTPTFLSRTYVLTSAKPPHHDPHIDRPPAVSARKHRTHCFMPLAGRNVICVLHLHVLARLSKTGQSPDLLCIMGQHGL